jgi:hypothetical protein
MQVIIMTLWVNQKYPPAYHPQSNGKVERLCLLYDKWLPCTLQNQTTTCTGTNTLVYSNSQITHLRMQKPGSLHSFSSMAMNPMT